MEPEISYPRTDFPPGDTRAWLSDEERDMLAALLNSDLSVSVNISVKLVEYRGVRTPKKLTVEQEARETVASRQFGAYCKAVGSTKSLLYRLAATRKLLAEATAPQTAPVPVDPA